MMNSHGFALTFRSKKANRRVLRRPSVCVLAALTLGQLVCCMFCTVCSLRNYEKQKSRKPLQKTRPLEKKQQLRLEQT